MKKIRICFSNEKTLKESFEEYILGCKSRNLRDGTIRHYRGSVKYILPDTPISWACRQTMASFRISLRDAPDLDEAARDLKTPVRFPVEHAAGSLITGSKRTILLSSPTFTSQPLYRTQHGILNANCLIL